VSGLFKSVYGLNTHTRPRGDS